MKFVDGLEKAQCTFGRPPYLTLKLSHSRSAFLSTDCFLFFSNIFYQKYLLIYLLHCFVSGEAGLHLDATGAFIHQCSTALVTIFFLYTLTNYIFLKTTEMYATDIPVYTIFFITYTIISFISLIFLLFLWRPGKY